MRSGVRNGLPTRSSKCFELAVVECSKRFEDGSGINARPGRLSGRTTRRSFNGVSYKVMSRPRTTHDQHLSRMSNSIVFSASLENNTGGHTLPGENDGRERGRSHEDREPTPGTRLVRRQRLPMAC